MYQAALDAGTSFSQRLSNISSLRVNTGTCEIKVREDDGFRLSALYRAVWWVMVVNTTNHPSLTFFDSMEERDL